MSMGVCALLRCIPFPLTGEDQWCRSTFTPALPRRERERQCWRGQYLLGVWLLVCLTLVSATSAQGKPEGTMTWALHFSLAPTYFDPAETTGIATPFKFLYALHDALLKPLPQGMLTPCLAESWTESPDGMVYDFKLREGLTFHNGTPVTAADVVFSFQRYKGAGAKLYKEKVQAVEVVDPQWVRFRLREPWPDFLIFIGTPATGAGWIVPKAYLEQVGDDGFKKHPIGAGPYKFVSHTPGVELVVEGFEGYWRKAPQVKRLVFKSVPEPTTRLAMLKKGGADVAYTVAGYLGAIGIKVRVRSMERPTMFAAWHGKTLQGVILAASGALGSASTRLENYAVSWGEFAYGGMPDLDELFNTQARERDPRRREAMLHELQRLVQERVLFVPIFEIAGLNGVGPRVAESGLGLIPTYNWSGPYEDVRLKP